MSNIKRRHFLQLAGSTLATVGISQLDIMHQGHRYAQVLAQNTPRKLALLVGINQYSAPITPLEGCVTDVKLQQELLIHRFGFNPKDILTLTDQKATRQGILTAFEEHLINQAKPGDVVVFHFSGHGSRVIDPNRDQPDGFNSTLVPIDSKLPEGYPITGGVVSDIMGHTLFLLMSALKTENVTVVLDCCHSGGGTRGNLRVRSLSGGEDLKPSSVELNYQKQWLGRLDLSPEKFIELRRKGVAKGVVIASAKRDELAADMSFSDFHAGAFTYALTQYLWQQTNNQSINNAIVNVGRNTAALAYQQGNYQNPQVESNLSQENTNTPIYFTPQQAISAEAVITKVENNQVQLWLGGLDSQTLEAFKKGAIFTALDSQGRQRGLVKLESRQGLIGQGKLLSTKQNLQLQPGTLLQERIRSIPNNLTLKIGIDQSFDNNITQQAIKSLQALVRIEPKQLGTSEVQYIFGRMTQAKYEELEKNRVKNLPQVGSLGLFLPSQDAIIPASFGENRETVQEAITRLKPKFKSLLAARIIKQVLGNTNSSRLNVTVSMNIADSQKIIAETFAIRGFNKVPADSNPTVPVSPVKFSELGIPQLTVGTQIDFQIENKESSHLYVSILVIDAEGEMTVIFPNDWSASETAALIKPKQKLVVPQAGIDGFKLTIGEPLGIAEALVIASTTPLRTSLKVLQTIAKRSGLENRRSPMAVNDDLLEVTDSLLNDLDAGTRNGDNVATTELPDNVRGIDTRKLAAMAIAFEVLRG
ncbi:peptidase C14, caspase catalytic subunit p20 [Anabaena sp. WA102]|uniref:caspase family protein n=1 Tax=Anabaena sp. WA102 TaxID=1647413 RepID=UPI0006AC0EB9|nr:caspase family protein [Anabaena sp. WA102]ALB41797.1 peptidase C14, caspase catalytic subunit p20 [Anabaena sp. WA102]